MHARQRTPLRCDHGEGVWPDRKPRWWAPEAMGPWTELGAVDGTQSRSPRSPPCTDTGCLLGLLSPQQLLSYQIAVGSRRMLLGDMAAAESLDSHPPSSPFLWTWPPQMCPGRPPTCL